MTISSFCFQGLKQYLVLCQILTEFKTNTTMNMAKWEMTMTAVQRVVGSGFTLVVLQLVLIVQKTHLMFWH